MTKPDAPATSDPDASREEDPQPLSFLQVVGSVLASGLGIQSREAKQRDFTRGKPIQFLIAGLLFTVLFIGGIVTIVSLVT